MPGSVKIFIYACLNVDSEPANIDYNIDCTIFQQLLAFCQDIGNPYV